MDLLVGAGVSQSCLPAIVLRRTLCGYDNWSGEMKQLSEQRFRSVDWHLVKRGMEAAAEWLMKNGKVIIPTISLLYESISQPLFTQYTSDLNTLPFSHVELFPFSRLLSVL